MENQVPVCVCVWTIARICKQLCAIMLLDLIILFFTLAHAKILLHILIIKSMVVKLGNSSNDLLYNNSHIHFYKNLFRYFYRNSINAHEQMF